MSKNILITGASGLIGSRLTDLLNENGYRVAHLSRSMRSGNIKTYLWDIHRNQLDFEAIRQADAIIHLAGENIGDKSWSKERKNEILKSRTNSTWLLYDAMKKGNHNVQTFISASAIGYYHANNPEVIMDETAKRGDDFLAEVVDQWERFVDQIASLNIRVVKIRTGIVLSEKSGVLKEMMQPFKYYMGAPLGSGKQYISWIHIDDLCRIYLKALEDEAMQGAYNAAAPNPVTNKEFTQALANAMHKPILLPAVPSLILKLLLGEMADLVLKGAKVSSKKIQATGFDFHYEHLNDALKSLMAKRE